MACGQNAIAEDSIKGIRRGEAHHHFVSATYLREDLQEDDCASDTKATCELGAESAILG
jgi:hypothetical protein